MVGIVVNPTVNCKAAAKLPGGTYSAITRGTTQHHSVTFCQHGNLPTLLQAGQAHGFTLPMLESAPDFPSLDANSI